MLKVSTIIEAGSPSIIVELIFCKTQLVDKNNVNENQAFTGLRLSNSRIYVNKSENEMGLYR
jgi:hypothetical protein